MKLYILALALFASAAHAECSWEHPGADPYKVSGHTEKALDDYSIDGAVKEKLRIRMLNHQYDEVVSISRDDIRGEHGAYANMRDMHFGDKKVCRGEVDRHRWDAKTVELGLVYCEGDTCIIVPTVCNNVALISKVKEDEVLEIGPALVPMLDVGPLLPGPVVAVESVPMDSFLPGDVYGVPSYGGGFYWGGGGGTIGGGGSCGCVNPVPPVCPLPPLPAVPELDAWLQLFFGLVTLLCVVCYNKRVATK